MPIDKAILERKGVRKAEDIPHQVLQLLNEGAIETVNLTEWLATDQLKVLSHFLTRLDKGNWLPEFEATVQAQKKITANNNTRVIGQLFAKHINDATITSAMTSHPSDVVRCWACWALTHNESTAEKLATVIKPFAADRHFGVREVAIFATKEKFSAHLADAISTLATWTTDTDENVRRFVAEVLRPIGVWTKKIEIFQQTPELGLPLLEPLKDDPSKYVQNSVANWLNDASKSQPEWVSNICDKWQTVSNSKATQYIIKRALRTIQKKS